MLFRWWTLNGKSLYLFIRTCVFDIATLNVLLPVRVIAINIRTTNYLFTIQLTMITRNFVMLDTSMYASDENSITSVKKLALASSLKALYRMKSRLEPQTPTLADVTHTSWLFSFDANTL